MSRLTKAEKIARREVLKTVANTGQVLKKKKGSLRAKTIKGQPRMKKEIKRIWVEALRSGKYKQTRGRLCRNPQASTIAKAGGFCCLGVLVDLYAEKVGIERGTHEYDALMDHGILPAEVSKWAGIDCDPVLHLVPDKALAIPNTFYETAPDGNRAIGAASLNDHLKLSFEEIAALIEKEL